MPIQVVVSAVGCHTLFGLRNVVQLARCVSPSFLCVPVKAQLRFQIEPWQNVERKCSVTKHLRVIIQAFLHVEYHYRVRHAFKTKLTHHFRGRIRGGIAAIGCPYRQPRQHLNHCSACLLSASALSGMPVPRMVHHQINARGQPFGRLGIVSQLTADTLCPRILHNSLVVAVIKEGTHRRGFRSLLNVQLVVMPNGRACSLLLPVGIVQRIAVGIEVSAVAKPVRTFQFPAGSLVFVFVFKTFHKGIAPFLGVHHFHFACHVAYAHRALVAHLCAFCARKSAFGCYHDNAIGTASAIDSRCRSIFQHLYALNVVGVHHGKVVHHHAVYHVKRVGRSVDGGHTANNYARRGGSLLRIGEDVNARHLTAKVIQRTKALRLNHVCALGHGDRARYVALTHRAIAHNNNLVEHGFVLSQRN